GEDRSMADVREVKRVLLVDDIVEIRYLMRMLLANVRGCQVVAEAANGVEAVELAERVQPDIVVLDVQMPLLDGFAALPRILEAAPRAKVVVYSSAEPMREAEALRLGAFRYVQKGTDPTLVVDAVRDAAADRD
ncbi:MAG: response regulator transcription factor, partial [Actinomycetota bacterium]|nr:response regulator transcription factor [Actinomycetota bacterium]